MLDRNRVTSILITAILLPMAYGYDYEHVHNMSLEHVRKKLQTNFFIATVFMIFALSYHVVDALPAYVIPKHT